MRCHCRFSDNQSSVRSRDLSNPRQRPRTKRAPARTRSIDVQRGKFCHGQRTSSLVNHRMMQPQPLRVVPHYMRRNAQVLPSMRFDQVTDMRLKRINRNMLLPAERIVHAYVVVKRIGRFAKNQHVVGFAHMPIIIHPFRANFGLVQP